MSSLSGEVFRRYDETPDEEFYRTPCLVTHIDNQAIAAVTQLYRECFPPGGSVGQLDVDAGVVLRETGHLTAVVDWDPQLVDPAGQDALDVVLPQPRP
jgi:hypothetical protein